MLILLLVLGCSRTGPQVDASACADPRGDAAFPNATTQDWVTYGDHLVSASVKSTADKGWVELIPEGVLWSRTSAQPAPSAVRAWSDGDRASAEGVDLLEGHTYLVLLTRRHPTGEQAGWSVMDVMGFDHEVVGRGPKQCWPAGSRPAREELWRLDASGVRQVMTTTQPDPLAARYADLDPGERHQRIAAERG